MKEKFYGFRQRLSRKRWFRLATDRYLPGWFRDICWFGMAFFDFHIWDLLFYNRYVEKPVSLFQPFWPWVVGGLSYLLCMFFYLVHGLDVYDDESKDHRLFFVLTALEPVYVWLMYVLY